MTNHKQQKQQMRKSSAKMIPTTRIQVRKLSDSGTIVPAEFTSSPPEDPPLVPVPPLPVPDPVPVPSVPPPTQKRKGKKSINPDL